MKKLKKVHRAFTKEEGKQAFEILEDKWGNKYPYCHPVLERNWKGLSVYFRHPEAIRRVISNTHIIESIHSQFQKWTKLIQTRR